MTTTFRPRRAEPDRTGRTETRRGARPSDPAGASQGPRCPDDRPTKSSFEVVARRKPPEPSHIYRVFWEFACERQRIYLKRLRGSPAPWTDDPVLQEYRFTNVYRASDRVSQALLAVVLADPAIDAETLFFRTILFKLFNRTQTWDAIVSALGPPNASTFDFHACDVLLSGLQARGQTVYSGAYIMPSGGVSGSPKHRMHLNLLRSMLADDLPKRLADTASLQEAYALLLSYPSIGPFLAFQYAIDLNYTCLMAHDEAEFVVPGPGALDGLSKCFLSFGDYAPGEVIHWVVDRQESDIAQYGLSFENLWGRRLQPIDVQNVFCEISKYTRASHPSVSGVSGRTRIKRRFTPGGALPRPVFPARWDLNPAVERWLGAAVVPMQRDADASVAIASRAPSSEVAVAASPA